jgi:hypothetical protein
MQGKLLEIFNVDFDGTGLLLIMYSAFVKCLIKNGNKMKQCTSYLKNFKNSYDSLRKEVLCHIPIEFGIKLRLVRRIKLCLRQSSCWQTFV